ncbi:MAG: cupin domain-containing protein [Smithellaceae bacterium]
MFYKKDTSGYRLAVPGVWMKTLVYGDKSLLTEFKLEAGFTLPRHAHEHEQTGYLVYGELKLTIGKTTFAVKPGDSWNIPGGVEHEANIIADSVAIEVFSPARKDYLPQSPK